MNGASMYVMYQDGSGNLTLSPRLGTGHSQPREDTSSSAAKLTLLAGSGVANGVMTANFVCPNCESWSGGSLSLTDTASEWIAAWKSGSSLSTTSKSASISQHDDHDQFQLDLTQATVSTDSNPFLQADNSDPGTGTGSGGGSSGGGGGSSDPGVIVGPGSGNPFAPVVGRRRDGALVAHSVIMTATFAALYPLGSMLMPLTGSWIAHALWQAVAFILMWVGFGLGIRVAQERHMVSKFLALEPPELDKTSLTSSPTALQQHSYKARNSRRGPPPHPANPRHRTPQVLRQVSRTRCDQLCSHLVRPYSAYAGRR